MEKELSFEKAVDQLEKIVAFLEGGEAPLEEALKKYEEGVKLSRLLGERLAKAEKKIEILTKTLDGSLKAEPFDYEGRQGDDQEETEKGFKENKGVKPSSKKQNLEKSGREEGREGNLLF